MANSSSKKTENLLGSLNDKRIVTSFSRHCSRKIQIVYFYRGIPPTGSRRSINPHASINTQKQTS